MKRSLASVAALVVFGSLMTIGIDNAFAAPEDESPPVPARSTPPAAATASKPACGVAATPYLDLHSHLFMKAGLNWFFSGDFSEPLHAHKWSDGLSSQANA